MEEYESFFEIVEKTSKLFKELNKQPGRVISHLDADGITACAIIIKALQREQIPLSSSIIKQLTSDILKELSKEDYPCYIFTDLGSSSLSEIKKILSHKTIFILDHHKMEDVKPEPINLIHPHLFNIDGSKEISASGIAYLFAKSLNKKNEDLAHLAIIGAIGDIQEYKGFKHLNTKILEDAIKIKKIKVITGLRIFGAQTRPIHKVLEYSTDPFIPGITGSEENALNFLNELGINPREGNHFKKLVNLSEEELKILITGIILKRLNKIESPDDVLGPVYILEEEENENPTKDAKEFSTLLNACGRLNKESLGLGLCLGDKKIKEMALKTLTQYKKEITGAINWFYKNRNTEKVIEKTGFTIINAEDQIRDTLIGTLSSILSKSNIYQEDTFILSLAHTLDGQTKVSFRTTNKNPDLDLKQILSEITQKVGDESGGHKSAAGAVISQEKEAIFIKSAIEILKQKTMEEVIG